MCVTSPAEDLGTGNHNVNSGGEFWLIHLICDKVSLVLLPILGRSPWVLDARFSNLRILGFV